MDTPVIKLDLTLEVRYGRIRGALTQSNSPDYMIELTKDDDGFTLTASNRYTGSHEELDGGLTIEQAVTEAMRAMGKLAHDPFPGFEPAEEN